MRSKFRNKIMATKKAPTKKTVAKKTTAAKASAETTVKTTTAAIEARAQRASAVLRKKSKFKLLSLLKTLRKQRLKLSKKQLTK